MEIPLQPCHIIWKYQIRPLAKQGSQRLHKEILTIHSVATRRIARKKIAGATVTATITEVLIIQDGRENPESIAPGHVVEFRLKINFHALVKQPIYGLAIKSPAGALVLNTNSRDLLGLDTTPDQCAGSTVLISFFIEPFLDCGTYLLSFGVVSESASGLMPHDRRYDAISLQISHPHSATGDVMLNPRFRLANTQ